MTSKVSRRNVLAAAGGWAGLATAPANAAGTRDRLKIIKVDLFRVAVPMQDDIINSPELGPADFPMVPKTIVQVHTDAGLAGIGESVRGEDTGRIRRNADFLMGRNVFDLNLTRLALPEAAGYTAIEMALYDVTGKAVGWPVYRLLGGLAQRKVLVDYWCGHKTPGDMRRVVQRALAGKFQGIKIKAAEKEPVVEAVKVIHEMAPQLKVIVDYNCLTSGLAGFLRHGRQLDRIGNVLCIEDPIDKSDLAAYREMRRELKTPIALHLGDPKAMVRAIKAEACTIFNTGGAPGMAGFVANCYLAAAAGMAVWHGSSHDLGIADASYLHSCAAAPNCTLPSDILSYQRVDDLIVEPIEIRDSYAIVSDRPGLGVELDADAVRRYAVKQ